MGKEQINFPWKGCGKEFDEWFKKWCKINTVLYKEQMKKTLAQAWDAGLLNMTSKDIKRRH